MFRSEIGSGFEDTGGTPPPRIPRSTPPGSQNTPKRMHPKFCRPQNKRTLVSTVDDRSLVGTLMTIGDVTVSIAVKVLQSHCDKCRSEPKK